MWDIFRAVVFSKLATSVFIPIIIALVALTFYYRHANKNLEEQLIIIQEQIEDCQNELKNSIESFELDKEQNEIMRKYIQDIQKNTLDNPNLDDKSLSDFLERLRRKTEKGVNSPSGKSGAAPKAGGD